MVLAHLRMLPGASLSTDGGGKLHLGLLTDGRCSESVPGFQVEQRLGRSRSL